MSTLIQMASDAGKAEFKDPGAIYFLYEEVSYLLQSAKRPHFDDRPVARLRMNVMLYGPHGTVKTTCAKTFLYDYCGARSLVGLPAGHDLAVVLEVGGKGITWERQRGGATAAGDYIPPLLMAADFIVIPELFSTLGHTPATQAERMDNFNEMLEEGRITVSLSKMFNKSEEEREEMRDKIAEQSGGAVLYDAEHAVFVYDVNAASFACSRFFSPAQDNLLESSGFKSRFAFGEWRPSEAGLSAYRRNPYGTRDAKKWATLRSVNERAWRTTYGSVNYPDPVFVDEVVGFFFDTYNRIHEQTGISVGDLSSSRDTVLAAQLIAACAIGRHLWAAEQSGDTTFHVENLVYTKEDVWWAKRLSMPRLQQMYDNTLGNFAGDPHVDSASDLLKEFAIEHLRRNKHAVVPENFQSTTDFIPWCEKREDVSRATAFRRLKTLLNSGAVERTGEGDGCYTISHRWMRGNGLAEFANPDEDDEHTPLDAIFDPAEIEQLYSLSGEES